MQEFLSIFSSLAEYGAPIVCIFGLFFLVFYLIRFVDETAKQAIKENREQTSKFIETTERFCDVVKESNMKIDSKLDRISDKIDNIQNQSSIH